MPRKNICKACNVVGHNRRTCAAVPYVANVVEMRPAPVPAPVSPPAPFTPDYYTLIDVLKYRWWPTYKTAEWFMLQQYLMTKPPERVRITNDGVDGVFRFKIRIPYQIGPEGILPGIENEGWHEQSYQVTYREYSHNVRTITALYGIQEGIHNSEYIDRLVARG